MLSDKLQKYTTNLWDEAKKNDLFGNLLPHLQEELDKLTGEEKVLMKLLYATLPISDVAGTPTDVLLGYVRHALMLRENSPLCKDLPEDYFLHFVFYPRVNNEDLTDCRRFFYDRIAERIEGKNGIEAALEINCWACENMTYQSSNDRTESPMAAYRAGLGRCGEESTFAVTLYRSVGIPARQIYVPFWAHCDDNHAWVEVYVDGGWHFLGACEPEPILDRGWFTDASSRAPLECFRTFFDYEDEGMSCETLYEINGICRYYNVVDRYAKNAEVTILVTDECGKPVKGAAVHVDVVNMAAYQSICSAVTDENGQYVIRLGLISAHVEAWYDGCFAETDLQVSGESCSCQLVLKGCDDRQEMYVTEADYPAPGVSAINRTVLTAAQQEENALMLAECAKMRRDRIKSYYLEEYDSLSPQWQEILHLSGGNAPQLALFEKSVDDSQAAAKMLQAMATKDYRDVTCEILLAHWDASRRYKDQPHFAEEIQNPRIHIEMIENWRDDIAAAFTEEEKMAYIADPQQFMNEITKRYPQGNERYYPMLSMQPTAVLRTGRSDERGRRLLFVAGMRTFGVPARINPADETAEYYRDGRYHRVEVSGAGRDDSSRITLCPQAGVRFVYGSNYTLARWEESLGRYRTLNYSSSGGEVLADAFTIDARSGEYRLLTAGRLPNGAQQCRLTYFSLVKNQEQEVDMILREAKPEEMLCCNQLDAFSVRDASGKEISGDLLSDGRLLLIYLEVSKEPTEHIINELVEAKDAVQKAIAGGMKLVCILKCQFDLEDPTLGKLLSAVPETIILYDDFKAAAVMLARKMFLEPEVWPLVVLADEKMQGRYGTYGYQVGTAELVLKLNTCLS